MNKDIDYYSNRLSHMTQFLSDDKHYLSAGKIDIDYVIKTYLITFEFIEELRDFLKNKDCTFSLLTKFNECIFLLMDVQSEVIKKLTVQRVILSDIVGENFVRSTKL